MIDFVAGGSGEDDDMTSYPYDLFYTINKLIDIAIKNNLLQPYKFEFDKLKENFREYSGEYQKYGGRKDLIGRMRLKSKNNKIIQTNILTWRSNFDPILSQQKTKKLRKLIQKIKKISPESHITDSWYKDINI